LKEFRNYGHIKTMKEVYGSFSYIIWHELKLMTIVNLYW